MSFVLRGRCGRTCAGCKHTRVPRKKGHRDAQTHGSAPSLQKVQFNLTQTVGDIRRFIRASQPSAASAAYRLVTTQPRTELKDNSATISQAGLANAVVRQEM